MNWYKRSQYNQYGIPLEFKEKVEAPIYNDLLSEREMGWYDSKNLEYKRGPVRDYMKERKGMKGEIKWMSPDGYIDIVTAGAYNVSQNSPEFEYFKSLIIKGRRESINDEDYNLIENYKDRWVNGEQPYMGYIIYSMGTYFGQEGLHRAIMAKDLDVKEIPVLIINKNYEY